MQINIILFLGLFSEEILSKIYSVLPEVKEKKGNNEGVKKKGKDEGVKKKGKDEEGKKKKTKGDVADFLGTVNVDIGKPKPLCVSSYSHPF